MAYYYKLGNIPPKRHTQFRQPDGSLYKEELVSSKGFSGIYSNLYHIFPPTQIKKVLEPIRSEVKMLTDYPLQPMHLNTSKVDTTGGDYLDARKMLLKNSDVAMGLCYPTEKKMDYFYKNGEADELIYVHDGSGYLVSQFGRLRIKKGDYVVIPRTTIYQMEFDEGDIRLVIMESANPIETVRRYRNELGQLLEHSPYCERD
ncbi:MAG: homogentisate 1,2-dioxygenase, partial [Bacteroidota bacterium]